MGQRQSQKNLLIMAYLTKDDLTSHIYADIITEITRGNDALVDKAINAAVSEVKAYLKRYDLDKLFSDQVNDENLKDKVKDVACWKIIKLSNPNIDMQLFKSLYDDAISFFRDIMKGNADPDGWPYKSDDPDTPFNENDEIQWSSNKKRTQHF
jgi:phage gp36-like protein